PTNPPTPCDRLRRAGALRMRQWIVAAALLALAGASAAAEPVSPLRVRLPSPTLGAEGSPRPGGRMLHLSLPGGPNLLLAGEAVDRAPDPEVDARGENIPYFGHEVWVGPQSQWWTAQTLNPARAKAAAVWPPDPWLAHAGARLLEQADTRLVLEGAASPVSGVQMQQAFNLAADRAALEHVVEMRNIRTEMVPRDIWFNSRVPPHTRVYVP